MATQALIGSALQVFRCFDFSGGLDIHTAATKLGMLGGKNRWLSKAFNVLYDDDGSVSKRPGMYSVCNPTSSISASVIGGTQFRKSDGTVKTVFVTSGGAVAVVTSATAVTSLTSGLSTSYRPSFAVYNDTLFFANGVDAPAQYDGTTWAALGGSSPATARVLCAHGNRLFATATAVPSRLYWSKLNAPTDWAGTTDAGFLDVNPNDGGVILNLLSSNQELLILKENRTYRLQGIGPATGYTVVDNMVPTTGSVGTVSTAGAVWAANDAHYVSRLGLHRLSATAAFGDLTEGFSSNRVTPYFRVGDAAALDLTPSIATHAQLTYVPELNTLVLWSQAATATGQMFGGVLLAQDLGSRAWAQWGTGPGPSVNKPAITAIWPQRNATTGQYELALGIQDQTSFHLSIAAISRGQTSDLDGAAVALGISAQVRHVSNLNAPGIEKAPRYLYLYFKKESGTTTMTLNLYADFKTTAVLTTTFDITSSTAETQVVKRIDLGGFTCEYLGVSISNSQQKSFTFNGYECQFRERRLIRRAE